MKFYTVLLAGLIGWSSLQLAEAKTKHPKAQHSSSKVKHKKFKKTKVKHAKR